uniref:hypothetical protein n=1 Tax=Candidatus Electrothrix sp. TaxID=2170559 RepID=UPI0040565462
KHGFFLFVRAITISLFLVSQFYWCIARKALPLLKNIIPVFLLKIRNSLAKPHKPIYFTSMHIVDISGAHRRTKA